MKKIIDGYVIRLNKYKESDAIVTILTENGIDTFKARGIYKNNNKNAYALNLYSRGEYIINYKTEGGNETLISASLLSFVDKVYESLEYALLFGIMGEIANKYSNFYIVFDYIFNHISEIDVNVGILFCLKFICKQEGVLPIGDKCIYCESNSNIVHLSFTEGGFICSNCNDNGICDDKQILHAYHIIYKMNLENLPLVKLDKKICYYFIDKFYDYLESSIGIKLVSKNVFLALKE